MIRRSLWVLLLLAVVCAQAQAQTNPVTASTSVDVYTTHTANNPYRFKIADFPFTDTNGRSLLRVVFQFPGPDNFNGNLRNPLSPTVVLEQTYVRTADDLRDGNLVYYPAAGQTPQTGYDSFTFQVQVLREQTNTQTFYDTSNEATMTINLVIEPPAAPTGTPAVTATDSMATAHNEDVELTASTGTVIDDNYIDTDTLMWQWQQSATMAGTYENIDGSNAATFTPQQEHVDQYIRVCLRFTDGIGTVEGPLCSPGNIITAVNDAPTSENAFVDVPITATADEPYVFKTSDFPFMDEEDGTTLGGVDIASTVASGKGELRIGSGSAALGNLPAGSINILTYYPPPNITATPNFATFTFKVTDVGGARSEIHRMTINLKSFDIRLRLRLFLEGPLR